MKTDRIRDQNMNMYVKGVSKNTGYILNDTRALGRLRVRQVSIRLRRLVSSTAAGLQAVALPSSALQPRGPRLSTHDVLSYPNTHE